MQLHRFLGLLSLLSTFLNQHTVTSTRCTTERVKTWILLILFLLVTLSQLRSSFHQAVSTTSREQLLKCFLSEAKTKGRPGSLYSMFTPQAGTLLYKTQLESSETWGTGSSIKVWRERENASICHHSVKAASFKQWFTLFPPRKGIMMAIYNNNMSWKHMMENTYERIKVYSILAESKRIVLCVNPTTCIYTVFKPQQVHNHDIEVTNHIKNGIWSKWQIIQTKRRKSYWASPKAQKAC